MFPEDVGLEADDDEAGAGSYAVPDSTQKTVRADSTGIPYWLACPPMAAPYLFQREHIRRSSSFRPTSSGPGGGATGSRDVLSTRSPTLFKTAPGDGFSPYFFLSSFRVFGPSLESGFFTPASYCTSPTASEKAIQSIPSSSSGSMARSLSRSPLSRIAYPDHSAGISRRFQSVPIALRL